jgi:hypothetical protein
MFIGYYKSVNSLSEFYSEIREDLNFPAQVELKGERYILGKTIQLSSMSHYDKVVEAAKRYGITYGIKVS